ncbi:hypothetical protein [Streptomyces sp. NPDC006784]|uniref:hypothetical protein n=1 Tax=Streptomyces sp. NPDC006784 TaxID=3364764 RepID=UPI0036935DCB
MADDQQRPFAPPSAPPLPPAPPGTDPVSVPPWRRPAPAPELAARHDDGWWDRLYADDTDTGPAEDWWDKPLEPTPGVPGVPPVPIPQMCTHPQPHPVHAQPTNELVAYWCADCGTQLDVPEPAREPRRRLPAIKTGAVDQRAEQVRQHLHVEHRTWVLLYNGSAAGLGWAFGLVDLFGGWITGCGRDYSVTTALLLGSGIVVLLGQVLDRRTRGWWGPLPWICRAPLASAVLALGLYAPASL